MTLSLANAISFLRNQMYNTTDKLCRESTKTTGNNYYVNSANGLYYTVMHEEDVANATEQLQQALTKKSDLGKANTTIYSMWADIVHPLWRSKMKTQYAFKNTVEENWGSLANGAMLNNNATGSARSKTENKLNVKCAYIINRMLEYYRTGTDSIFADAKGVYQTVIDSFDDTAGGYVDSITDYREAYKQGLVKICSDNFIELRQEVGSYQEATGIWDGTLQNAATGGIYMRYIRDPNTGQIVNNGSTFENVESTATIILAYRHKNLLW